MEGFIRERMATRGVALKTAGAIGAAFAMPVVEHHNVVNQLHAYPTNPFLP